MGQTWLTSDTHLGHEKVARIRGFATVDAHDAAVLRSIARRVGDDDRLFLLGDVVMGPDHEAKDRNLARIREAAGWARITVVLGNHDRPHPMHRNGHEHVAAWLRHFDAVVTSATVRHGGTTYLLSHFPYDGEGVTRENPYDRCTQWRLRDEGTPLIHGHVHDLLQWRLSEAGTVMLHAGLDAWDLAPVTIHDLTETAKETPRV